MYSIGQLAKNFNLSRTTLLYYDSIGLLKPYKRNSSRYRLYREEERHKLEKIINYRQMGIPLKEIKKIISLTNSNTTEILQNQLIKINEQIRLLRQQQFAIVKILKNKLIPMEAGIINRDTWISILKSVGLDETGMTKWHLQFEKNSPQAHYDLLASLGMTEKEIKKLRKGILK